MLPSTYTPKTPADFIGSARQWAQMIDRLIATMDSEPIKILINGQPGTGKSALAQYLAARLGCSKFSTTKLNGTQVKIEAVEELARSLAYRDLFGSYRLIWIEEADTIPRVAQVRFLTLLDDLPPKCAVVCTSNANLDDFEPRFQSRFQSMQVTGPESTELHAFIQRFFTPEQLRRRAQEIQRIATFACGNVRQALLDVQNELLAA